MGKLASRAGNLEFFGQECSMNTVQNIMDQIKLGQNMAYGLERPQPQGASQIGPADGVAPQNAASPGVMAAPVQPEGDSQAIAFNPAQIKAADLEGAHNALDPDRVARLLGLLD